MRGRLQGGRGGGLQVLYSTRRARRCAGAAARLSATVEGKARGKHPTPSIRTFLRRFRAHELPLTPTSGEANAAGPWVIEELSPKVFEVSRVGMSYARGYAPTAIFFDRSLALVAAAVLPGLGQNPLLIRRKRKDGRPGYLRAPSLSSVSAVST